MAKLNISGLTSVREINIKIERINDIVIGQKVACFLAIKNSNRNDAKITNTLSRIKPVNPAKL